jgi:predicted membrane-bound mannosyltransferase
VARPVEAAGLARRLDPIGLALVVAAALVRFFDLGRRSLWYDEAWAAIGLLDGPYDVAHVRLTPFLYAGLVRGSVALLGRNEIGVRLPAALFGTAAVVLAWVVARRLAGRPAGWLAATIVGLFPIPVYYGKELKAYAAELFLTLALAALTGRLWHRPATASAWIGVALAAVVGTGLTPVAPLLVAGALLALVPVARRAPWAWLVTAAASGGAALAWYFLVLAPQVGGEGNLTTYWRLFFLPAGPPAVLAAATLRSAIEAATFGLGTSLPHHADSVMRLATLSPRAMYALGVVLLIGAVHLVRTGGGWFVLLALAWHVLVVGAAVAGRYPYGPARIALFFLGPTAVLLAAAVAGIASVLPRVARPAVWLAAAVPLFGPLAGTWRENWSEPFEREELRPVLEHVFTAARPDDVVWVSPGAVHAFLFYVPQPDARTAVAGPIIFDVRASLLDAARRARGRLWLVFGHRVASEHEFALETLASYRVLDVVERTGAAALLVAPGAG